MLRFPLSFLFIIIVQFQNMKVSLKRISDFLGNPEIDPDALRGGRKAPALNGPPPARATPAAMEVVVERASPSTRAALTTESVTIVEIEETPKPSTREELPADLLSAAD